MTEYRIVISVEELDEDGKGTIFPVMRTTWEGGSRLIHGMNEGERIMKILSVAQVPGA